MKIIAPAVPWQIDVLKVDLKNKYNSVETAKGGGQYIGQEPVSSMAKRNSYPGHVVVGGEYSDKGRADYSHAVEQAVGRIRYK